MSRTLDKYGINIRNTNLQQKLSELGIQANISALNQNDKALLRTIVLLENSTYAWTDLSRTLSQPANQLRLLRSNVSNLSRTIGNIFLPIVANAIPYINGFVIALQRLAEYIVKLLGFKDFDWGSSIKIDNDLLSDIYDGAEELSDGLGDAADNAKKLKYELMGFDEINKLSDDTDTSGLTSGLDDITSGLLDAAFQDALDRYMAEWNKAFDSMENKANSVADNIVKAFKSGDFKAIGEYISNAITESLNMIDWSKVKKYAKSASAKIAGFLNGFINPKMFGAIGRTLSQSLNTAFATLNSFSAEFDWTNLGVSIATGINEFFANFDPFAASNSLNKFVNGIETSIASALKTVTWKDILQKTGEFLGNLELDTIGVLVGAMIIKDVGIVKLGEYLLTGGLFADLASAIPNLSTTMSSLASSIGEFVAAGGAAVGMAAAVVTAFTALYVTSDEFRTFVNSKLRETFDYLRNSFSNIKQTLESLIKTVQSSVDQISIIVELAIEGLKLVFSGGVVFIETSIRTLVGTAVFLIELLADSIRVTVKTATDTLGKFLGGIKTTINGIIEFIKGIVKGDWSSAWNGLEKTISGVKESTVGTVKVFLQDIKDAFEELIEDAYDWGKDMIQGFVNGISDMAGEVENAAKRVAKKVSNFLHFSKPDEGPLREYEKWMPDFMQGLSKGIDDNSHLVSNSVSNVTNSIASSFNLLINKPKEIVNSFKNTFNELRNDTIGNDLMTKFDSIGFNLGETLGRSFKNGFDYTKNSVINAIQNMLSNVNVSLKPSIGLAGGANSGLNFGFDIQGYKAGGYPEDGFFFANSTELVGKFSNGKTAVANNADITAGIEEASYRGMMRALSEANTSQNVTVSLEGDASGMFKVIQRQANDYTIRTGMTPFPV